MALKILFVTTSYNGALGQQEHTGSWVEEVASPYYLLRASGFQIDFASIAGGEVPWDPSSTSGDFLTSEASAFLKDEAVMQLVKNTKSVAEILSQGTIDEYVAVFLPGGHGIVFDGKDDNLKQLLDRFIADGKIISAVCHGPAGLLTATTPDGKPLVDGKEVTGFTNTEEVAVGKDKDVPFLLEDELKRLGGTFLRGDDWAPFAVVSDKLITGQNPASSKKVAELLIQTILPTAAVQHGKGPGEGLHHRQQPYARDDHHEHTGAGDKLEHPQAHMHQWNSPAR